MLFLNDNHGPCCHARCDACSTAEHSVWSTQIAQTRIQAREAIKEYQEKVRKLMDQANTELVAKMKDILTEDQMKEFKESLNRPRVGRGEEPRQLSGEGGDKKSEKSEK